MRLRMRLFFPPHLRVGVEPVAGPLPGVSQLLHLPPQGVLRDQIAVPGQVLPQQGHGPGGGGVAQFLRAAAQQFADQVADGVAQQGGPSGTVAVGQGIGIAALGVGGEPVVDGAGAHPQSAGDRADGLAGGDLEDGQGAAVDPDVVRGPQLPFQAPPLPVGQGQGFHRLSPSLPSSLPSPTSL
jgi:hypothetical protein